MWNSPVAALLLLLPLPKQSLAVHVLLQEQRMMTFSHSSGCCNSHCYARFC
jgi:hypothetical protein